MDGPRTKVELFAAIRRDSRTEKLSIHELSRRYGVHRRLVREALTSPWPTPRKTMPPRPSVIDPYKHLIASAGSVRAPNVGEGRGSPSKDNTLLRSPSGRPCSSASWRSL
jgi:hypothetical protein